MRPRPKYQVFISSTYGDLREEREAVTWAILTARHIPAGMENFTASDDRGWRTIKSVIDRSDYYVLILAGRYGSVDAEGKSWTQREYEYALNLGIPILAFARKKKYISAEAMDDDAINRKKIEDFRSTVRDKHLGKDWESKADLVTHVIAALQNHILDDEENNSSRPGWYRGDQLPSMESLDEFARISTENAQLRSELQLVRSITKRRQPLMLTDYDSRSIESSNKETKKISLFHPSFDSLTRMVEASYGFPSLALNIIRSLQLAIYNPGDYLVDQVTVDINLTSIIGFSCGWHGRSLRETGGTLTNDQINIDSKNKYPFMIRLINSESIFIRFRIPSVPGGGTEYLPPIFVLGTWSEEATQFGFTYKIVANSGSPVTGEVGFLTVFDGVTQYTANAEKEKLLELHKISGRNLDLNDMKLAGPSY